MRRTTTYNFYLIAALFLAWGSLSHADTFTDGGDAYKAGDYETAVAKFMEVAEKGDHRAMYALGSMYAGGNGVKQDYKEAFRWFTEAARYGRIDAQYKLGLMYEFGAGVKQNFRQAARLYREVGQKGYAHGQFKFGQLYLQGKGVKQDLVKAYAWITAAKFNFARSGAVSQETTGDDAAGSGASTDIFATIHTDLIDTELAGITPLLSPAQLEQAQALAAEYAAYR